MAEFELYRDAAGRYRYRLRTRKGKIIAVGEGFTRKADAEAAIRSVQRQAPTAVVSDRTEGQADG